MPRPSSLLATIFLCACTVLARAQVINVDDGDFIANGTDFPNGATVNVLDGGTIGLAVDLSNGELNILGGNVALGATAIATGFTNTNNIVNVSGGNVGPFFQFFGSTGDITGGTLETFGVFGGSDVSVRGGTVTGFPDVFNGGTVTISGGNVSSFRALSGSTINLVGTQFSLDGSVMPLVTNQTTVISARSVTLAATLTDNSPFDVFLNPFDPGFPTPGVALPSATITVTRTATCDLDGNAACDIDDLNALLAVGPVADGVNVTLGNNETLDLTGDSVIDFADVEEWLALGAAENGFDSPYIFGDANLDGFVDGQDFIAWNDNRFTSSITWDSGDFNGDGFVDGQDFIVWNDNRFTASDQIVAVPEPNSLVLFASILAVAVGVTRKN